MDIFRYLGASAIGRLRSIRAIWRITVFSFNAAFLRFQLGRKATTKVLLKQVYFTGFEAIPIVTWIALILGLIIVTQLLNVLPGVGAEGVLGDVLVWVVVREVGPLFAAVVVIARSGTAIASEIGTMKIAKQITALEVMGIDPMQYLIMPRVVGTAISVFVLTFYFEVVAILGGYILAGFGKSINFTVYMSSVLGAMGLVEVGSSIVKSVLFGVIIGAVCTCHGLMVGASITQIPQHTTKAVIASLAGVFVMDAAITFILFMR